MSKTGLNKVIHDMIKQYLAENSVGFKEEIIIKVLNDNPDLNKDDVTRIYDVEYEWWSDAYSD